MATNNPYGTLTQAAGSAFGLQSSTVNTIGQVGGILGGLFANSQFEEAGQIAIQGGAMSAASYRQAGDSAVELARYNTQIISANLAQQLGDLGRAQNSLMSTQRAQIAHSGLDPNSQSYLAIASATLDDFSRQATKMKLASSVQQQGILFQGELSAMTSENQARNEEYQARLSQYQQENRKEDNTLSTIASLASFAFL